MVTLNTNLAALNAQNKSALSASKLEVSIQRLSSGLRINSAKDDAAGLAIANRMTSQKRGLDQVLRNTQDGLSLVSTAEGALSGINDHLQRIRELTVQGLSESYNQNDVDTIQGVINLNLKEIERLSRSANYNGIPLLSGQAGNVNLQVGAYDGEQIPVDLSAGFSVDNIGLKDLVIRGISGSVTPINTVTGTARNMALNNPNIAVSYPAGLNQPQLVRNGAGNLFVQSVGVDGKPEYRSAAYSATWDTASASGAIGISSNASPLYDVASQVSGRSSLPSVTYSDSSGNPLNPVPAPTLTQENDRYYIEQNGKYLAAEVVFGQAGAVSVKALNTTELDDADFATTPATVSALPAVDTASSTLNFTDSANNSIPAGNSRLLKQGSQYVMEVDDGGGNFRYFNAAVTVSSDGTNNTIGVKATSLATSNGFTPVSSVSGTSTVTMDPATVEVRYTNAQGAVFNDVLRRDADGNYYMDTSDAGQNKSVTLVQQDNGKLLLRVKSGVGEIQTYYDSVITTSTETGTNHTVMNISEVGSEMRFRHPENPLAAIDNAIRLVDAQRSQLGSMANRLQSVQNERQSSALSVSAARSRIEDADYAMETASLVRAQILQQAGNSALSQATQLPQIVLSLLK